MLSSSLATEGFYAFSLAMEEEGYAQLSSGKRAGRSLEAGRTSSSAQPSRVSLCPFSHTNTARLERQSSSGPRMISFSPHPSHVRTICCSGKRCICTHLLSPLFGASRSLLWFWRAAGLRKRQLRTLERLAQDKRCSTSIYLCSTRI